MAFDGLFIHGLLKELNTHLKDARVNKITQPEEQELILTLKTAAGQERLFLSADSALPLIYLTSDNKPSPMTAPGFCMLLRKHLSGARILEITQPGLERILRINFEHRNELGDLCQKSLVMEVMGKHSNIIFVDDGERIIDSIRHVSPSMSSLRTVLPGREYFIAPSQDKKELLAMDEEEASRVLLAGKGRLSKAISSSFTGISSLTATECCILTGLDPDEDLSNITQGSASLLVKVLYSMIERTGEPGPVIYLENGRYKDFAPFPYTCLQGLATKDKDDLSSLLEEFYSERNRAGVMKQKSADLRKIVQTALEKSVRKGELQRQQLKETEEMGQLRLWGELLQAYASLAAPSETEVSVLNYYVNREFAIPLDPEKSSIENSKQYFERYGKLKRTAEAVGEQLVITDACTKHLRSVMLAFDTAESEEDLKEIREELVREGYIKKHQGKGKDRGREKAGSPLHYISSDGFDIYVGKNNIQNEKLSLKEAGANDWWFHAKNAPGSHVIVMTRGEELPDRTFEEAARLAGFYSSLKGAEKAEIDYTLKKNLKKPAGSAPGYVIYHTNYSMLIDTDISGIKRADG